jgi:Tfp pilus assembly protein PilV
MTLVELMVVLLIFSIGVLAMASVQTKSGSAVFTTGHETRAMSICQAQIETARADGFGVAVPDSGQTGIYQWETEIVSVNPRMDEVHVIVSWTEQGDQRSVRLNTLLSAR